MKFYQIIKNFVPRIVIVVTIILVALSLYFIYIRVWQIFVSPKDALSEKDIIPVELKTDLFEKINQQLEEKLSDEKIDFENIKTPFTIVERETGVENEEEGIKEGVEIR